MIIRKMTAEDVSAVVEIEKECFSLPWSQKSFLNSLERDDTLFLVCVDDEANVQGYVGMYISFGEAEITNVAVDPKQRKRGYADALISRSKEMAKDQNVTNILLEVRMTNQPAISLYKKHGFAEIGIRKGFYEFPTEDARIMTCQLTEQ